MQSLANSYVAVDTFLLMSGLLVSYLFLHELDRINGRFNIVLFYLHRYLRLTAVYVFILIFPGKSFSLNVWMKTIKLQHKADWAIYI